MEKLEIVDETGATFDQHATIERSGATVDVTFESRSGRERNPDYAKALLRLLVVFANESALLEAATVESRQAIEISPSAADRNIQTTRPKPIPLNSIDLSELRLQLTNHRRIGGPDGEPNPEPAGAWKRATYTFSFPSSDAARDATRNITAPPTTSDDDLSVDDESTAGLPEGARRVVTVNVYERKTSNRRDCIKHHGTACAACDMRFKDVYGDFADGFIHVHHVVPVSQLGSGYRIDPTVDLVPVCPNCHAMLHLGRGSEPRTVKELRTLFNK